MKNNKRLLFSACGFVGGMLGALAAELTPFFGFGLVPIIAYTTLWSAIIGGLITVSLFASGEIYNRKPFSAGIYGKGIVSGLIAGAIAGFVAQAVYSTQQSASTIFNQVIFRSFCWAIMGALLGWKLSAVTPNLGKSRGIIAGAIGGFIGGVGFILTSAYVTEVFGRMFGLGILGAALGFSIVAIEEMFRRARLEIIWAPKEITTVTLGERPVTIGGGDDHIFVRGLPTRAMSVVLQNGKIKCTDSASGQQNDLKEGSRIQIGKVEIVVHTKDEASA